jgi:hypothetical protein
MRLRPPPFLCIFVTFASRCSRLIHVIHWPIVGQERQPAFRAGNSFVGELSDDVVAKPLGAAAITFCGAPRL